MEKTDDNQEIQNLKKTIEYAQTYLQTKKQINYELVNEMHKIILDSVRGSQRTPGKIRTTQNWIGPRGCTIEGATFIPPVPEEVYGLLINLYDYMNDAFTDPLLVNVALSHMQFETIHAYKDGNGRLGRALIPVQMAMMDESTPILYMSEILELYKPSYQRYLMECRRGNVAGYIKFFLQCVIDQCNSYTNKLERIKVIYKEDMGLSALCGGLLLAKSMKRNRLMWGALYGVIYFLILFIVSIAVNKGMSSDIAQMVKSAALCILCGAVGGVIS